MSRSLGMPRIVIAATGSGVGKTTATVALISALRARGLKVAAFKCGPDYLDPTYHRRSAGVNSHNLDGWMMGCDAVLATFARASRGFDIAIIEGMMGLFDSATPTGDEGSTAEIAKWLDAPVLLVADTSGMARSIAAMTAGYSHFDHALNVAGVICNRIGGRGHLDLLQQASSEVPVVGGFPADTKLAFPERHLGLRSADEDAVPQHLFDMWSKLAAEWLDLDAIVSIARNAPPLKIDDAIASPRDEHPRCRIGLAWDDAFHFYYEDNLRLLEECGAEIIRFSPSRDVALPDVDGLYFGGGYPEVLARELSGNHRMIDAVRAFAEFGHPVYAECGGLMYLADAIRSLDGVTWPMVGLIPGVAVMAPKLQALGYVEVETRAPSVLGPRGTRFRGHQFRYSILDRDGAAELPHLYDVQPKWGPAFEEGYVHENVIASYIHAHWASNPDIPESLVRACASFHGRRS
ncbi:MAG TPA: cobyrinate a,c-diamide synthase [Candidatus Binataceae bacterium]|nr:cobyrinate a,c-diamide synthase [Candidatus Binataceae bacterium]